LTTTGVLIELSGLVEEKVTVKGLVNKNFTASSYLMPLVLWTGVLGISELPLIAGELARPHRLGLADRELAAEVAVLQLISEDLGWPVFQAREQVREEGYH